MHDERQLIEARIRRELRDAVSAQVDAPRVPMRAAVHVLPGEPVPYDEIVTAPFSAIAAGTPWGRPWGTTWFRLSGRVPEAWAGRAVVAVVDLGFTGDDPGFQAEGLVWRDGEPRGGIHPKRRVVALPDAQAGTEVELLIEAASNPSFAGSWSASPLGSLRTAGEAPLYVFGGAQLAVHQAEVEALKHDLRVLDGVMRSLPLDDPRRARLLATIERALDALDLHDVAATAGAARAWLAPALAVPARASAHRVVAVGHAHIDTAWLWPLRETVRKCTRTFASAIELLEEYPEHRFACSQAVQYAWMEERHPALFARITEKVRSGEWVPVGGMWVEADMNVPSGESIVRQLVHGQRYFESRFGVRCPEVWIPDVFGYPGSLPQIFAAAGCPRFVTQKLSWNKQNRMPHHTFWWEGIDGTRVLTHFPPVDTYNAQITPGELAFASSNFADKAWSDWSLMPFGYGDGGGGPTREMLERARRVADLDGMPRVEIGTPSDFFDRVEQEAEQAPVPVWQGELYFEMHRGTFTSQAETKVGNRRVEHLLREAELWWAAVGEDADEAASGVAASGVATELDAIWKEMLVLQFHDILPGSSIAWVYEDAAEAYARMSARLEAIIADALGRLAPPGHLANAATHDRDEVVTAAERPRGPGPVQDLADGRVAHRAVVPGSGLALAVAHPCDDEVTVDGSTLRNGLVELTWDDQGDLTSIVDRRSGREVLREGGGGLHLELGPDHPVEFDAWDLERWARRLAAPVGGCESIEVVAAGPLLGTVRIRRRFGDSTVEQELTLRAGSPRVDVALAIDWHEDEQLLSLVVPLEVRAPTAGCAIQFGHVHRPTHANTSWDAAKFEVCAHRWVDLSEPSFGVAVLNDGRYGHAVQGGAIRVSLLRAPRYPDPEADRGSHRVTIAVLPHGPGLAAVLHEAEALNLPLRPVGGRGAGSARVGAARSLVSVDHPGVRVSAIKRADDGTGDLIVRLYEALGDRSAVRVRVRSGRSFASASRCNLLEEVEQAEPLVDGGVALTLRPFELVTLRLSR